MAFDGIVTRAIASELNLLSGARIDKIFEPNKNTIVIGMYLNGNNYALNISIEPGAYRMNLTTHPRPNPKIAPNFCMLLRKHLIGLHLKNVITNNLERIITLEFEGFDDVDDIISKKLIVELMGKHCNIILLDNNNIIIDSIKHINNENTNRIIMPHSKYLYPTSNKTNLLDCNLDMFLDTLKNINSSDDISIGISDSFNGISKKYISFILNKLNTNNLEDIYKYLFKVIFDIDSLSVEFENINNDYFLVSSSKKDISSFYLNFFLDDFYYNRELEAEFKNYKNTLLKSILFYFDKYKKRLKNMDCKLKDCENLEQYKLYGELITANLYKIPNNNISQITLENYYDNNNLITINLDKRFSPSINAKKFFKKYSKLKNTLEIVSKQKESTILELEYLESVIYEIESSNTINELLEISSELDEIDFLKDQTGLLGTKKHNIKKSNFTKNKNVNFNPLKYKIDTFTFLVGRNNKENDYLTLKHARKSDIWFHTKDIHGSHGVLLVDNKIPTKDILEKCAEITAFHSKAKFSSNVPVDFCEIKYVKKPKGSNLGMVTYSNNSTIYVTPKEYKK